MTFKATPFYFSLQKDCTCKKGVYFNWVGLVYFIMTLALLAYCDKLKKLKITLECSIYSLIAHQRLDVADEMCVNKLVSTKSTLEQ